MSFKIVLAWLLALSYGSIVHAQVPERLQKRVLKLVPEVDANGDKEISEEELRGASGSLPSELQLMLQAAVSKNGKSDGSSETATHKVIYGDVPARNRATPFIDPLFKFTKHQDIQFTRAKSGAAEIPLLLDVYQPTASDKLPKSLPAIILLFGGGWTKGSKDVKYIRDICEFYAARGYVAISAQYRIKKDDPPAVAGPLANPENNERYRLINAAIEDTANAVRWVRANASTYQIDPDRIAVGGVSAGAFNSLYVGLCDEAIVGPNARVSAVLSFMGSIEAKYIDKSDPPIFIAHGTTDNVVPYAMVEAMVSRLDKAEASYAIYPVPAVAHRLQAILDAEFDGRTVKEHSLDFCFIALRLDELTNHE